MIDVEEFERKHKLAIARIRNFCTNKKVLCAFSGGKDSQSCYHLLEEAGIPFIAQYSITRFEPPELLEFIHRVYPNVTYRRAYKRSLVEDIVRNGLPTMFSRWCCNAKHVKTEGFDIAVIGVRAEESSRRAARWRSFGQKPDRTFYCCPIIDWTSEDVWYYLNDVVKVEHCCLYDEGYKRIGCVMCPLSGVKHMQKDMVRYPKVAKLLRIGSDRFVTAYVERLKANGWLKRNGQPVSPEHYSRFPNPQEECWQRWIQTAQIARTIDHYIKQPKSEEAAPCLFAGSGFSESDGLETEENNE